MGIGCGSRSVCALNRPLTGTGIFLHAVSLLLSPHQHSTLIISSKGMNAPKMIWRFAVIQPSRLFSLRPAPTEATSRWGASSVWFYQVLGGETVEFCSLIFDSGKNEYWHRSCFVVPAVERFHELFWRGAGAAFVSPGGRGGQEEEHQAAPQRRAKWWSPVCAQGCWMPLCSEVTQLPSLDSTRRLLCSGLFPEDRSQATSDSAQETDSSGPRVCGVCVCAQMCALNLNLSVVFSF